MSGHSDGSIIVTGLIIGVFIGVILVGIIIKSSPERIKSNHLIAPIINTECINNVCDTTYVYLKE